MDDYSSPVCFNGLMMDPSLVSPVEDPFLPFDLMIIILERSSCLLAISHLHCLTTFPDSTRPHFRYCHDGIMGWCHRLSILSNDFIDVEFVRLII